MGVCRGKDYYKILQVDEKATPADIKKVISWIPNFSPANTVVFQLWLRNQSGKVFVGVLQGRTEKWKEKSLPQAGFEAFFVNIFDRCPVVVMDMCIEAGRERGRGALE